MNVEINGARIFFEIPILGGIPVTETMVNAWCVMALIIGLCIWLTRGLKVRPTSKKQIVAEFLVQTAKKFVIGNMGEKFSYMVPFVSAIFATSVLCSLSSLIGAQPATADLSTELAWAVVVFIMITATKIKTNGLGGYLKGYTQPVFVLTPFNILSELATPISMAFVDGSL